MFSGVCSVTSAAYVQTTGVTGRVAGALIQTKTEQQDLSNAELAQAHATQAGLVHRGSKVRAKVR
jgi:hypothetical protein